MFWANSFCLPQYPVFHQVFASAKKFHYQNYKSAFCDLNGLAWLYKLIIKLNLGNKRLFKGILFILETLSLMGR